MNVGLDVLELLRFQKQLMQIQAFHGVALHQLDDRFGKVGANIVKPARDSGR